MVRLTSQSFDFPPLPPLNISPHTPPPPPPSWPGSGIVVVLAITFGIIFFIFIVWNLLKGYRNSRARAEAAAAALVVAAVAARPRPRPQPLPRLEPHRRDYELQLRGSCATRSTARLPGFRYSRSVKHNVTGGGDDAATCPVCLGAFQLGETVRLLPVCLHLYHVACIDPWLDAHSTCPLCRSDTDPTVDIARLQPV